MTDLAEMPSAADVNRKPTKRDSLECLSTVCL